jgi:hypothetical protein
MFRAGDLPDDDSNSFSAHRIVVADENRRIGGHMLAYEHNHTLEMLKLALIPATNMLNTAPPGLCVFVAPICHNEP